MIDVDTIRRNALAGFSSFAVLLGAAVLAIEPVVWLVETWMHPAYDSPGGYVFVLTLSLVLWSASSERRTDGGTHRHAWWLLVATALVRLAGRILAVDVLGALALTIDVYAIATLGGLHLRRRALSPFWLAALFSLSLPVERILQRLVGYGLQHLSAAGSCSILRTLFDDVTCAGVDITLLGRPVLVDLPCSGARGLVLLSVLFAGLAALVRPSVRESLVGLLLAAVSALVANSFRIAALAVGLAYEPRTGVDVMTQPWHDLIGFAALAIGLVPLVGWARLVADRHTDGLTDDSDDDAPGADSADDGGGTTDDLPAPLRGLGVRAGAAVGFLAVVPAILLAPSNPVDVSTSEGHLELPDELAGYPAEPRELGDTERAYFERYGGAAAKASYGPRTLLVVETDAPLRHLHAPDTCLEGAGYTVETIGKTGGPLPAASYRATAPDGTRWRVDVTYVSEHGRLATSVAEAVWHWMGRPETTWRALQRFHPVDTSTSRIVQFETAIVGSESFGLTTSMLDER